MNKRSALLLVCLVFGGGLAAGLGLSNLKDPPTGPASLKADDRAREQGKKAAEPTHPKPPTRQQAKGPETVPPAREKGIVLPPDKGNQLLETMLPAYRQAPPPPTGFATGPRPPQEDSSFNIPDAGLPRTELAHSLDLPLFGHGEALQVPKRPELPAGTRLCTPSPDLGRSLPLPPLGRAQQDRGPLGDPTAAITGASALAAQAPPRTTPVPFVRLNLPDPFENRPAVRLQKPPREDRLPPTITSAHPRP